MKTVLYKKNERLAKVRHGFVVYCCHGFHSLSMHLFQQVCNNIIIVRSILRHNLQGWGKACIETL